MLTAGAICACLAALSIMYLGTTIQLALFFGRALPVLRAVAEHLDLDLRARRVPTRIRAFGVAFILATGSAAAGSFGADHLRRAVRRLWHDGRVRPGGRHVCLSPPSASGLGPETYGMSMEDLTQLVDVVTETQHLAVQPAKAGA